MESPRKRRTAIGGSGGWTYDKIAGPLSDRSITVGLAGAEEGREYIVGIRGGGTPEPVFVVGEAEIGAGPAGLRIIQRMSNVPRQFVRVSRGRIEITGLSDPKAALVVYGTVPADTMVTVERPGVEIVRGKVGPEGLLVHNDRLRSEPVEGMHTLTSRLVRPDRVFNVATPLPLASGRYLVTPAAMARNLVEVTVPRLGSAPACCDMRAHIRLVVNMEGAVEQVERISGNPEALDAVEKAVRQWRFRPFTAGGKAIVGEGTLLFFFSKDGQVSSPILTELGRLASSGGEGR